MFNLLAVNKNLPVNSVQELIDYARRNPGKLVMASVGNGTTGHLGGELFKAMTGTYILHVPYRGSPQAINDIIAGEASMMFDNMSSITPHVKAGRVRGLGVSGPRRSPVSSPRSAARCVATWTLWPGTAERNSPSSFRRPRPKWPERSPIGSAARSDVPAAALRGADRRRLDGRDRVAQGESGARGFP